jgi:hypothetical protein
MGAKREAELEAIVRELMPATRDVLWCALVWNDHNFGYEDFKRMSDRAAKALGYERHGLGSCIDEVNEFLARVDRVLDGIGKTANAQGK